MRGVAGEQHPALAIGRRQTPMDAIGPRLQHFDAARVRHDVVQQVLLRLVLQRLLGGLAVARIEADAPDAGQPQQAEGAVRLPAIGDVGQALRAFRETETAWSRGSWSRDRCRQTSRCRAPAAPRCGAIRADHIITRRRCCSPSGDGGLHRHAVSGLLESCRLPSRRCSVDAGQLADRVQHELAIFRLLALQAIRMLGLILQHRKIEHRALAGRVQPDLPGRTDQARLEHPLR